MPLLQVKLYGNQKNFIMFEDWILSIAELKCRALLSHEILWYFNRKQYKKYKNEISSFPQSKKALIFLILWFSYFLNMM
jgi:hypothetical protein